VVSLNNGIWIILVAVFLLLYNDERQKKNRHILVKSKMSKEIRTMSEIIKDFIGKECVISTMNTDVVGVIESVQENWVRTQTPAGSQIVNIDYVSSIREYTRKKNGKKKMF
jgi:hypothetical protein